MRNKAPFAALLILVSSIVALSAGSPIAATVSPFPQQTPSGGFRSIDGSDLFMCALSTASELYCWGNNTVSGIEQGASDGTYTGDAPGEIAATSAIDLGTDVRVHQFDVGNNSTCAVIDNGGVKCWGQNTNGSLGYGDTTTRYNTAQIGDSLPTVSLGNNVTAIKVGVGVEHACVITNSRNVKCWGGNAFGQIGRGDTNSWGDGAGEMGSSLPNVNLGTGVVARDIHVGSHHTCVLTNSGSVKCWGRNDYGQLGIGSTANIGDGAGEMGSSLASVSLPGGTVLAMYGGAYTTCVRMSSGSYCWGLGNHGIRFDGTTNNAGDSSGEMGSSLTAMSLGTYEDVLDYSSPISNAFAHACVIISSGRLKCAGQNGNGQLGRGSTTNFGLGSSEIGVNLAAVDLGVEDQVIDVAVAEHHSCALLITGEIKCWGLNDIGQLGVGSTTTIGDGPNEMGTALVAVPISNNIEVASVAPGGISTCVTLTNGAIKCWGGNSSGQLGQGSTTNIGTSAGDLANLNQIRLDSDRARVVQTGMSHSCAITVERDLQCWGGNSSGQLGLGDTANRGDGAGEMGSALETVDLGAGSYAVQVAVGNSHTCALLDNGTVKCWGDNSKGALGRNNTTNIGDGAGEMGSSLAAIDLGTGRRALQIGAGDRFSCALLDNGAVKCWGYNNYGQLGQGTIGNLGDGTGEMAALAEISLDGSAVSIAVGTSHACAVLDSGALKCWGRNAEGQLGLGDALDRGDGSGEMGSALPEVSVSGALFPRTVLAVAAGNGHTCALLNTHIVKCWGRGTNGQLGYETNTTLGDGPSEMGGSLSSVNLGSGRTAIQLGVGSNHTCVVLDDNTIKCWGLGVSGQIARSGSTGSTAGSMGDNLAVIDVTDSNLPVATWSAASTSILVASFDVDFDEPVYGIDDTDFTASGSATGCTIDANQLSSTRSIVQATCTGDGDVTVTLLSGGFTDYAGNSIVANSTSSTVSLDTTPPSATITTPGSTVGTLNPVFTVGFDATVYGIAAGDFIVSGTATPCTITTSTTTGTSVDVTTRCTQAGTVTLTMAASRVYDDAGNYGPAAPTSSSSVTITTTNPTPTVTPPSTPTSSRTLSYGVVFNQAVSGFATDDISNIGTATCTDGVSGSGTSYTVTLTCTTDGTAIMRIAPNAVTGTAGTGPSTADVSTTIEIDATGPTASWTSPSSPSGSRTVTFDLNFNEPVTIGAGDITTGGSASGCTPSTTGSGATYSVSVTCTSDGTVFLNAVANAFPDALANTGPATTAISSSIVIDTAPLTATLTPSVTSSGLAPFNVTATFNETAFGLDGGDFSFTGTATGCSANPSAASGLSIVVVVSCAASGTVVTQLTAGSVTDGAGNLSPASLVSTSTVTLDSSIPSAEWGVVSSAISDRTPEFIITFDTPVSNFTTSDVTITAGASSCSPTSITTTDQMVFIVTVTCTADVSSLSLELPALSVSSVATTTSGPGSAISTTSVAVDTSVPSLIWSSGSTSAGSLSASYILNFSENVSDLETLDFSNTGTATGCAFTPAVSGGVSINVSVTCTDYGTIEATLASLSVLDDAGNAGPSVMSTASPVTLTIIGPPSGLITLTPSRIINTRPTGKIGNRTGTADPMIFNVHSKGGLPASGIGAVLLNVTVVDPEVGNEGGYLTVYPCASGRPDASNLNFVTGQIIPNTVIAPVDPSGNICFYSYGKTHVLADVSGYFPTGSSLTTLTPSRIINTRPTGKIGNRTGTADPMIFNVHSKGGLPASGIGAVLLNVTVVDPEVGNEGGYLTVYPCASGRPDASNLNFVTGQIIPNTVIAPVDPSGNICFYSYGKTHVLADVSGYFPTGSSLTTLTPSRIINTRPTGKIGNRTGTADPMIFNVHSKGGLPASGIGAVLLNVTVVDPEVGNEGGYLTVYPCASGRPDASNLNFVTGQIIPNTVIAPVDPSGNICFYSYGKTHVLADVSGYFPS